MADNVLLDIQGDVAYVTLNRPDVHNAFDEKVIEHLTAIFEDIVLIDEVIAVVLRGNGKSFSAGGDLNWMKRAAGYTEQENYKDGMRLATMLNRLYTLPKVTIACVQGAAMGGGLGLVSCCDVVLAQAETMFALSEVKLGLIPATIAPYVLRALGERQSRRYFQTGERFRADRALALGLVHEIYGSDDDLDAQLQTLLGVLRSNGPKAMVGAKRLCMDFTGKPITDDLIAESAKRIAATRAGDEAKEGIGAFIEKRKPLWSQ